MAKRSRTDFIILHCSATPPNMDIGRSEIDKWHKDRGWAGIGYHYVIRRDGTVEDGRPLDEVGAHVQGHNNNSVGVCLVGGVDGSNSPQDNFTDAQWASLTMLVEALLETFPNAQVKGHRDFDSRKACPSFDVAKWRTGVIHRESGLVDAIEIVYRRMGEYPEGCEVHTVLKSLLNEIGHLK